MFFYSSSVQDCCSPRPSPSLTCPLGASGPLGRLSPALTWSPSWSSFNQLTTPMITGWYCLCQPASAASCCHTCSLSPATWLRSRLSTQRAPVSQSAARRLRQKVPKGGSVPFFASHLFNPSNLSVCLQNGALSGPSRCPRRPPTASGSLGSQHLETSATTVCPTTLWKGRSSREQRSQHQARRQLWY